METNRSVVKSYKIIIATLAILAIVLGLALLTEIKKNRNFSQKDQRTAQQIQQDLLKDFPKEALIDPNATELPSSISTIAQGKGLNRVFQSKKTIDELSQTVENSMKSADWIQEYKVPAGGPKIISYTKGDSRLLFVFSTSKTAKDITNIVVTYYPHLLNKAP